MTQKLSLTDIILDPEIQIREVLNQDKIQEYAEVFDSLPPITVFHDEEGRYWLADGFHRYKAARLAGRTEVEARVVEGPRQQAIVHAALANGRHGLPLTRTEKVKAIKRLLALQPEWSDRLIASSLGVSNATVGKYRRELEKSPPDSGVQIEHLATESTVQIEQLTAEPGAEIPHLTAESVIPTGGEFSHLPTEPGAEIPHLTTRRGADGKTYPARRQAPVRREPVSPETEEHDVCPHGLCPEHCSYCQGWEPAPEPDDEPRLIPVNGNGQTTYVEVEPEDAGPQPEFDEGPRQIPVNGNGQTTYVTVEEPAPTVEERLRQATWKQTSPAIGAPTAAGQHCPHCGDGRGREICNVCGRNRWIIAFDNIEDYQKALALMSGLLR